MTFFPHNDDEDYAVSYDGYFSKVLYESKGHRSKKREQALMEEFREAIGALAQETGGEVYWDRPLCEARKGWEYCMAHLNR